MAKIPFNDNRQIANTPIQRAPDVGETEVILSQGRGKAQAASIAGAGVSFIGNLIAGEFQKQKQMDVSADVANGAARIKGIDDRFRLRAEQLDPQGANYSEQIGALMQERDAEVQSFMDGHGADGVSNLRYPEARQAIDQTNQLYRVNLEEAVKTQALRRSMANTQFKIDATQNEIIRSAGPDAEIATNALFQQMIENGMDAETARIKKTATLKAVSAKRASDFQTDIVANIDNQGSEWALGEIKEELVELRSDDGKYRHLSEAEKDELEIGFDKLSQTIKASKYDAEKRQEQEQKAARSEWYSNTLNEATKSIRQGERLTTGQLIELSSYNGEYDNSLAEKIDRFQQSMIDRAEKAAEPATKAKMTPQEIAAHEAASRQFHIDMLTKISNMTPGSSEALEFLIDADNQQFMTEGELRTYDGMIRRNYAASDKRYIERLTDMMQAVADGESKMYYLKAGSKTQGEFLDMRDDIEPVVGEDPDTFTSRIPSSRMEPEQMTVLIEQLSDFLATKENLKPGEAEQVFHEIIFPLNVETARLDVTDRLSAIIQNDRIDNAGSELDAELSSLTD